MPNMQKTRVCAEPGCPDLTLGTYCPRHRRDRDRARGSSHARGYGRGHQAKRRDLEPLIATGTVNCARCGQPIRPDEPWDLGHDDHDRSRHVGPEHARCNRATRARRAG